MSWGLLLNAHFLQADGLRAQGKGGGEAGDTREALEPLEYASKIHSSRPRAWLYLSVASFSAPWRPFSPVPGPYLGGFSTVR